MNQENKTPHNFCETPEEKCTMNYCDENGCQNRKRHLVEENKLPTVGIYWPDEMRAKMIERSEFYPEQEKIYQYGYYDGFQEYHKNHTAPLREELEKLRAENEQFRKLYMDALGHRAKLREALERIIIEAEDNEQVDWMYIAENMVEIAKEALKGATNE